MGLEKLLKREIGITIATVLLVTTIFIMFSYAIFKVEVSGDKNVITFGDVKLSFCKDRECNSTIENIGNIIGTKTENGITKYVPIYPQADPTTTSEWESLIPYTFTLTNDGALELYVSLFLEKEENPELKYTMDDPNQDLSSYKEAVEDNQIKIGIGESGTNPTPKLYSETLIDGAHKIADGIHLAPGETKIFNLYAWLVATADNASQGKYFVTQISARGEYMPASE